MHSNIALFAYKRPLHVKQVVESLLKNPEAAESSLTVFADGARGGSDQAAVQEVRDYFKTVTGFNRIEVIERKRNFGLAANIIAGVSETLEKSDSVIVIEDDILVAPCFLSYMNAALEMYREDEKVASIHGYNYPVGFLPFSTFFLRGADCWGWATWSRAWKYFEPDGQRLQGLLRQKRLEYRFDLDGSYPYNQMLADQVAGRNQSWAIRWHASMFVRNMYTLYPSRSLVENIGLDGSGEHCHDLQEQRVDLPSRIALRKKRVRQSRIARRRLVSYFRRSPTLIQLIRRIGGTLWRRLAPSAHPKAQNEFGWFGDYPDWKAAESASEGYGTEVIARKVLDATLAVKQGRAAFERDSVLFDRVRYSWPVSTMLLYAALRANGRLSVVDFGGALGSHFFQNRSLLKDVRELNWTVVEQPRFVQAGQEYLRDNVLNFSSSLDQAIAEGKPDVLLMSSVLPYLPDPLELLRRVARSEVPLIVIDRTFFAKRIRITVQKVSPAIYDAQYPCWFLTTESVEDILGQTYSLLTAFDSDDGEICPGVRSMGMIWQRK